MHRHVELYLDESGDLGFSSRSPEHFVIVALATAEPHKLVRTVRKAHRKFSLVDGAGPEFKFNRGREPLRRFLLDGVVKTNSWFAWGSIEKSRVPPWRRSDKEGLWQHAAARTVAELSRSTHTRVTHIHVDRRTLTRIVRDRLSERLRWEVERNHGGHFPPRVTVSHIDSATSAGLQIADHIAGAVFLSLERGDSSYLRRTEGKCVCGGYH
jgi:hypothetical protein